MTKKPSSNTVSVSPAAPAPTRWSARRKTASARLRAGFAWVPARKRPARPVSLDDARLLAPLYCPEVLLDDALLTRLVELAHGSVRRVCVNLTRIHEEAMLQAETAMTLERWGERGWYTGEAPRRCTTAGAA